MEYIVSARKYRPLTFDTVVGQTTLTTTLKNAVKSGRLAHAYLFCGPRGVGKTTCARIFARAINCLNPSPEGEACGECESCRSFLEQRSYNIFELDAASNNSVDDIRQLMEQTRIPPQVGKYKVFIIDEVHMLSAAAFNAFLKTLEEPPAHVVFILATTEKHKLLPTIISRCQMYDFERITIKDITDRLRMVAEKEGYTCEEEALSVIAEKADGAMRDALSIFDQVAGYCRGNITYAATIEDLNVLDVENYFRIIDFSLAGNTIDIMLLLDDVISRGFDPGNLCLGLARHIRNVMMAKDARTTVLIELSDGQKKRYAEQAARCTPAFLFAALKLLNTCETSYRQSTNKRLLVELTLIQIAQLMQGTSAPAAGQQNTGRLKPLFGNKQQSANITYNKPQASAAVPGAAKPAANNNANTPAQPSGLGFTFAANKATDKKGNAATEEKHNENAGGGQHINEPFTQETLEAEWSAMCGRLNQTPDTKTTAMRMMNIRPAIKTYPQVEVTAENDMLYGQIKSIAERIQAELRRGLKNTELTLSLRLAEQTEMKPKPSKGEILEKMKKNNPAIGLLFNTIDLELS